MAFPILPVIGLVGSILDKVIPDRDAAEKAKQQMTLLMANQEFQTQLAQIQVNMEEAKTGNWFTSGWRPFIGWTCGLSFAYAYLILPFLKFGVYYYGTAEIVKQVATLPDLDLATMLPVLFGMLGLGAYRSVEKIRNAEKNR